MKDQAINALVTPIVEAQGLEVDRIENAGAGKRTVLRIALDGDGPDGRGPSLDDIAAATRAISDALDSSDVMGERPYVLEVSSRGVSRPLTAPKHYRRNVGRLVALTLADEPSVTGRIVAAGDDEVEIDVDGVRRTLGYPSITKAVVQVELNRAPDEAEDADGVDAGDEEE
ncbi:ribosome maturation factor RimP [Nigerium massiliense]|uniref:ribosome maturation factor RimP n=1 Tax=Nigerium massiliense TaxID=1522317 RepID=UPI00058FAA00|nr:ribosome maturation factor RimP [Nigerium massiliense]